MLNNFYVKLVASIGLILAAWATYREVKQSGRDEQELEQQKNNQASAKDAKDRLETIRTLPNGGFIKRLRNSEKR